MLRSLRDSMWRFPHEKHQAWDVWPTGTPGLKIRYNLPLDSHALGGDTIKQKLYLWLCQYMRFLHTPCSSCFLHVTLQKLQLYNCKEPKLTCRVNPGLTCQVCASLLLFMHTKPGFELDFSHQYWGHLYFPQVTVKPQRQASTVLPTRSPHSQLRSLLGTSTWTALSLPSTQQVCLR